MRQSIKALIAATVLLLGACVHHQESSWDAVVSAKPIEGQIVYRTIAEALQVAMESDKKPFRIYIAPGDYYEKLILTRPHIHFTGAGKDKTRWYYNAWAGQANSEGELWGTRGSGTIIVRTTDLQFQDMTIENSFDFVANDRLDNDHPEKIINTQAVALHFDEGSDRNYLHNVRLAGYQDTLFVNNGRVLVENSEIAGNVDFIFGAGNAVFYNSDIISRIRGRESHPSGYITAPSTNIRAEYGMTFIACRLLREPGVPDHSVALGRPWHPTTQFSDGRYADPDAIGKTVFIDTQMDTHIAPEGWHSMSGTAKDGGRIVFTPDTARFFEFKSSGAGSLESPTRRQLTDVEAVQYRKERIPGDWDFPKL